jgi:hypothetical protein
MRNLRKLSCFVFVAGLLLSPPNGSSCGPFFPGAIFVHRKHPGTPLQWYAEGHLGVVLPSFNRSYLVIAYRNFSGHPLSADEVKAALSYWRWEATGVTEVWTTDDEDHATDAVKEWLAARKLALGGNAKNPALSDYHQSRPPNYGGYRNCLDDSFHTAALTLSDRSRRFGADQPAIQEWVQAQDMVFSNCDRGQGIPPVAKDSFPAWLKADRQYQIAAANFYVGSFDQATQQFDQIASDHGSPWHELAPYLAARAMIRKATMAENPSEEPSLVALRDAESRLQKIIDDPARASMHRPARALLGYVACRLHPQQRNAELARLLAGAKPDPDFYQDLIDYTRTLDSLILDQEHSAAVPDEMTEWVLNFPVDSDGKHAVERWRQEHSLPWLVAALTKVGAADPSAKELLEAAAQVPAGSPAFATVTYHRARLLMQRAENDKARALLDTFLKAPPARLTGSSRNLFLGQRMHLATSYQDFLARAPRPVVDTDEGYYGYERLSCQPKECDEMLYGGGEKKNLPLRFDRDTAWIMNLRLPLELLGRAATGTELPEPLRGEVAAATWTRAVMLDRHDIAAALVPEIEKAYPVMKEQLESYLAAKPEEKKQAALFAILYFPGLRPYVNAGLARETKIEVIDSYRDNWWCADVGAKIGEVNGVWDDMGQGEGQKAAPAPEAQNPLLFLSAEQKKAAGAEWRRLAGSGAGSLLLLC